MTARAFFALLALLLSPVLFAAPVRTTGPALPTLTNAAKDVRDAGKPGVVVIVLFSLPGCHYCEEVRSHYLAPLARDATQRGRLMIREVDLNSARKLIDFDGSHTTQAAFAQRMKVQFAPTVLFLDADGRQVASPLVGAGKADFYGAYLDDAIAIGVKAATR
ncbi:thioredoxin-like domain protein [Methyloversatilis sp. RAC08]|uniref:thioredoxin fold domain-containing protein n=1 Tax=Methyloversatilis sp. RAC08 TaxID=1842540 RepID=UPI00083D8872|nr:thioredoxin fold domain-containing protein [Methyloversatilis sp. RAC08]AOF81447.1 thioredoxin-like domain protein [Methyloversatilis sp. RAC08]